MKLRYSATSPYVRKVMMVIHERGLSDKVELEKTDAWSPTTDLPQDNPLGKVPALALPDGTSLFDSPVIVEYLDSLESGPGNGLYPEAGPDRWTALRFQALADGICDAAILRRLEGNRPEQLRSTDWME
ncbi:MAG TPA: glutathione S-transferase N-terminal domain-containing protein, partial [Skermanella sp.]|nr:glutathione S-transferase N-terminal domain-containing protein [Skermanella sp.]